MNPAIIAYHLSFLLCALYAIWVIWTDGIQWRNAIGIYLIIITIAELVILYAILVLEIENHVVTLVYKTAFLLTFLFVALLYYFELFAAGKSILVVLMVVTIILLLFTGDLLNNTFSATFGASISLYIMALCVIWYINKIEDVSEKSIFIDPFFWYTTGLFMWSSLFLLRILPAQFLQFRDKEFLKMLQHLNLGINVISNILYAVGLNCSRKKTQG